MNGNTGCLPLVDILTLIRPKSGLKESVRRGLSLQEHVVLRQHVAIGRPISTDRNRWQTIARARNQIKQRARAPWVMFVDDDVVLGRRCIANLLDALRNRPDLGALAADYDDDLHDPNRHGHVGMGACLFRAEVLARLQFRSTDSQCECLCCCEDLRRMGSGIEYLPTAKARHLRTSKVARAQPLASGTAISESSASSTTPWVLAAFDRRDVARFEHQFLSSLRTWGNREPVIAVTYGLYPSQLQRLRSLPGVLVVPRANNGVMAPVRRLHDFAQVTRALPPEAPVAYWDVSDVIFQTSLQALWQQVRQRPGQVLAVAEPKGYPGNSVILPWSLSIEDTQHRRRALILLSRNPFLNSGFAAGTAATMSRYFATAHQMRHGPQLKGTTDWGDQMCLNIYCHSDPRRWHCLEEGWNYCIHDRQPGEVTVAPGGLITSRTRGLIPIAHGNARSLRQFSLRV